MRGCYALDDSALFTFGFLKVVNVNVTISTPGDETTKGIVKTMKQGFNDLKRR
jgi:hypothetical protein